MGKSMKLPVGIENFEEIRTDGYYYIDKTKLIEQLLDNQGKVNLFTRPRRFGKTLNMSMLKYFFEIGTNCALFDGLYISRNQTLCREHMAGYPVIFITLKNVDGLSFEEAKCQFMDVIGSEASRFRFLLDSQNLAPEDKEQYQAIIAMKSGAYWMSEPVLSRSLKTLSELLNKHYQKKALILIDEYDVPLDKSFLHGYYREMVSLMRILFGNVLKTNDALQFAVLTGCLRVSKESIFTGLNNFKILSITDSRFDEQFGFTDMEVKQLLKDYHLEQRFEETKQWYDGYHFGDFDVYCPWDVMNYLFDLSNDPKARPASYWKNTSDNAIIRSFIDYSGSSITGKLETLLAGGTISQKVEENLTYDLLHSSEENLWSILYLTGYLTGVRGEDQTTKLMIPNAEIREIFESTVVKWFQDKAKGTDRRTLFHAVWNGDSELLTREMSTLLRMTISYHDYKEDFYHAFLAGIFAGAGYMVESNREHGEGRSDVIVCDSENGRLAVFEVKCSAALEKMEESCETALRQIDERMYAKEFEDSYDQVLCYGISFYKKRCLVKKIHS